MKEYLAAIKLYSAALLIAAIQIAQAEEPFLQQGIPQFEGQEQVVHTPDFAALVRAVSPGVVNIAGEGGLEEQEEQGESAPLPWRDGGRAARSLGSGFIVNKDGYIVTNNHVVDKAERIIVRLLDDKNEYKATVFGTDEKTDIALLKIDAGRDLPVVFLGDSDELSVGEWVVAIGNQFQLGQTVTAGIVSAKSRRVPSSLAGPYDAFIQTDASINPGSSGGPLINVRGQVIGVTTAIFSPGRTQFGGTGFNIGIGFATPINQVGSIISQIKEHGRVVRGLLGVIIQQIDRDIAEALGLQKAEGALVADVMPDSPAAQAGFERQDVIVAYNGQPVKEHDALPILVAETPIGQTVNVDVIRQGSKVVLKPKIEELSDEPKAAKVDIEQPDEIGLVTQSMTEEIARSLNLEGTSGVIVSFVRPGSDADKAGLLRGDIIQEIAGRAVADQNELRRIIGSLANDKPVLILIRRRQGTRFMTLKRSR